MRRGGVAAAAAQYTAAVVVVVVVLLHCATYRHHTWTLKEEVVRRVAMCEGVSELLQLLYVMCDSLVLLPLSSRPSRSVLGSSIVNYTLNWTPVACQSSKPCSSTGTQKAWFVVLFFSPQRQKVKRRSHGRVGNAFDCKETITISLTNVCVSHSLPKGVVTRKVVRRVHMDGCPKVNW